MGVTHVTVAVSNPADPDRRWEGLFLVDTGATDCYVPADKLREIGIVPRGQRTYELANGSEVAREVGVWRRAEKRCQSRAGCGPRGGLDEML